METVLKKIRKATGEGFAENEGFKPGMNNYRNSLVCEWE